VRGLEGGEALRRGHPEIAGEKRFVDGRWRGLSGQHQPMTGCTQSASEGGDRRVRASSLELCDGALTRSQAARQLTLGETTGLSRPSQQL
jgi:hypothetical protein